MITELILIILALWNLILSYYLFEMYFVQYRSLEDMLIKHMAGYSPEELGAEAADDMGKICEKRGWKVKESEN